VGGELEGNGLSSIRLKWGGFGEKSGREDSERGGQQQTRLLTV